MLQISWSGLLWTVINLLVFYLLLKKFLWQPVTDKIESRQKEIRQNLAIAEEQKMQTAKVKADYDARLAQAEEESQGLLRQAENRGRREYQAILASAQAAAEALAGETRRQLEADRTAMLAEVRKEVAGLAMLAASQVAGRQLGGSDDRALLEEFLAKEHPAEGLPAGQYPPKPLPSEAGGSL